MTVEEAVWLAISVPAAAALLAFAAKRLLYLALALTYKTAVREATGELPTVLVLVPCRNEAGVIGRSMKAVSNLDYPRDRLKVVYIDDSSTDETPQLLERMAPQFGFSWFRIETGLERGKARALNEALNRYGFGELIYILDADFEPHRKALVHGVRAMRKPGLAMVAGEVSAGDAWQGPIQAYSAIEELVHQHITQAAQSALGLGSAPMGGNYLIRRDVLDTLGGFDESMLLEDVDLALKLFESAQKSAFVPSMKAHHHIPKRAKAFVRQHYFWARGFHQAAKRHIKRIANSGTLGAGRRLAAIFFSFGYIDRPAMLIGALATAGTLLHVNPYFPLWLWAMVLPMPILHAVAAIVKSGNARRLWSAAYLPLVFPLDLYAAVKAFVDDLIGKPLGGYKTERE